MGSDKAATASVRAAACAKLLGDAMLKTTKLVSRLNLTSIAVSKPLSDGDSTVDSDLTFNTVGNIKLRLAFQRQATERYALCSRGPSCFTKRNLPWANIQSTAHGTQARC